MQCAQHTSPGRPEEQALEMGQVWLTSCVILLRVFVCWTFSRVCVALLIAFVLHDVRPVFPNDDYAEESTVDEDIEVTADKVVEEEVRHAPMRPVPG